MSRSATSTVTRKSFGTVLTRVSFDHNVESRLPFVVASGERAVRAPRQVDALLLGGTGAEVEGAVLPYGRKRRDVGPTVRADGRDPEQLGLVNGPTDV